MTTALLPPRGFFSGVLVTPTSESGVLMGRGVYRGVYSTLTDDPDFLMLSPHAKLVFYTLRLSKEAGPAAIFVCYPPLLVAKTGLPSRLVTMALDELRKANWIYQDGPLVWIRNGLRHDPNTTLTNDNHRKAVLRWLDGLPRRSLLVSFCEYYSLPIPSGIPSPIPSEGDRDGVGDHRSPSPNTESESKSTVGLDAQPGTLRASAKEVLDFLNDKTGRSYDAYVGGKPTSSLLLIESRLKTGASVQDCRGVIARKAREWGQKPEMLPYLRPKTLFNKTNFENYLGERRRDDA